MSDLHDVFVQSDINSGYERNVADALFAIAGAIKDLAEANVLVADSNACIVSAIAENSEWIKKQDSKDNRKSYITQE